jgi:hypothetical protein
MMRSRHADAPRREHDGHVSTGPRRLNPPSRRRSAYPIDLPGDATPTRPVKRNARPRRTRTLVCDVCGARSKGYAWFWTADLVAGLFGEGFAVVVHCPRCAEERLRYFSRRRLAKRGWPEPPELDD